jgi:cobyrinic acid a,c-diamide synthase
MTAAGFIVAAVGSGHGKTTVTLGLLRAFRNRAGRGGRGVGAFKVGPDYLDPMLHGRALGRPSLNLDPWAMRLETLAALTDQIGSATDLVIGEGVMGLFDGAENDRGSTAELASLLDLPVVLVIDAKGMGTSAAAVVEGFLRFRDDVEIGGVVFNRVGSPRHAEILRRAADDRFSTPVIGCLPANEEFALPARHLGLVQAGEIEALERRLERLGDAMARHLDLDRLERIARPFDLAMFGSGATPLPPLGQRIAVADDTAFGFAYRAVLDGWRHAGAELLPFSPLADEPPDGAADAVYLPGGYPELHAGALAAATGFVSGLRAAAEHGAFVYGECGGFMALGRALIDSTGTAYEMAGLLPIVTSFEQPGRHLGYRRLRLRERTRLGPAGRTYRGHEFHYAGLVWAGSAPPLFDVADARGRSLGQSGAVVGSVAGSFMHLVDRSREPPETFGPEPTVDGADTT